MAAGRDCMIDHLKCQIIHHELNSRLNLKESPHVSRLVCVASLILIIPPAT